MSPSDTPDRLSTELEERAVEWISEYWNARHLLRTRDWLLVLEPRATEAERLAALTHDMERHFPGGPVMDPGNTTPEDPDYRKEHSERSARIVAEWLTATGAKARFVDEVRTLILAHEVGGMPEEDMLQAADSLSFLETNAELVAGWFSDDRCTRERAKDQLRYMFDRIKVKRARELARSLYVEAIAIVDRA